jgi:hypothetical protein
MLNTKVTLNCLMIMFLSISAACAEGDADPGLAAYWPLKGDCRDHSGNANDGINKGVALGQADAIFNGIDNAIEVPDSKTLNFGKGNFTIALRMNTDEHLTDVIGDIITKYDSVRRKGFNLGVMNYAGVVTTQVNSRNLFFGIDDGKIDAKWTDCGRPGKSIFVITLCVYDGALYAGTCETGKGELGRVYRYRGGQKWEDCGAPDNCNTIQSLVAYKGNLYAGSAYHDPHGSLLPESNNKNPGGRVFRYEGGQKWTNCGSLGDGVTTVHGLTEFNGKLYAFSWYEKGFFRYDGGTTWTRLAEPGSRFLSLLPYNGHLYATANRLTPLPPDGRHVDQKIVCPYGMWRYDESADRWSGCGVPEDATQVYSSMIYRGEIYAGTWPNGTVFKYQGGEKWENCGRLDKEEEVMGLVVYNGKLYAGTLPSAKVFRYESPGKWIDTGQLDTTPDVSFRRAFTPVVYQGMLFCGTLPSGHVFSLEAGKSVSYDCALKPGWRHIAAVRDTDKLKLYVDGVLVANSGSFDRNDFDISNSKPLEIGFGANDYFKGAMRDMRLYRRALSTTEIAGLARQ